MRARDLAPTLGRFLSRDTVSPNAPDSQGFNPYTYVANNPTTWTDPSGHIAALATALLFLALDPALLGPVATGVFVVIVFAGIAAILDCALDAACRARFADATAAITHYGSTAAAGAWTRSGQATGFSWQHFPQLPTGARCALGAAEGVATDAVFTAASGNRSSASDTTFAATLGCASGGSGGGGGGEDSGSSSRSSKIRFDQAQLRDKFKHAADFGVTGNSNPANWATFREALAQFIDSPTTQAIPGTYRGTAVVTHYFDPATKLWVAVDSNGKFITGWRLTPDQERYLFSTSNVQ